MAGRVTQQPTRTAIVPDDALARVTQQSARTAIVPTSAVARVTQLSARVAMLGQDVTHGPGYDHKVHVSWVDTW